MNPKICYQSDGTAETASKILDRLGRNNNKHKLACASPNQVYFLFDNKISCSYGIPKGYTLGILDEPKDTMVYIKGVEGRGEEVIKLLKSFACIKGIVNTIIGGADGNCQQQLYYVLGTEIKGNNIISDAGKLLLSTHREIFLPRPKVIEFTLKTKDECMVKDREVEAWSYSIFSHYEDYYKVNYVVSGGASWKYCLPYNEDTKHLVGTIDVPTNEYKFKKTIDLYNKN